MYKCQNCNKISEPCEKQHIIITKKRPKSYRYYVVKIRKGRGKTEQITTQTAPDRRNPNKQIIKEFTTRGWEIEKELRICKECKGQKNK